MSIHSYHYVRCTNCGKQSEEAGETKREALTHAKLDGFVRRRVENGSMWDFCSTCSCIIKTK